VRKFYSRERAVIQALRAVGLQRTAFLIIVSHGEENGNRRKLQALNEAEDVQIFRLARRPECLGVHFITPFPGVKRPGRGVNHPPSSSVGVKERVELYLYSPSEPSWPVLGRTLLYFILHFITDCQ
jgi:hypothetical protein